MNELAMNLPRAWSLIIVGFSLDSSLAKQLYLRVVVPDLSRDRLDLSTLYCNYSKSNCSLTPDTSNGVRERSLLGNLIMTCSTARASTRVLVFVIRFVQAGIFFLLAREVKWVVFHFQVTRLNQSMTEKCVLISSFLVWCRGQPGTSSLLPVCCEAEQKPQ